MLTELYELFQKDVGLSRVSNILTYLEYILNTFDEKNLKDKNSKNAAIDTIIALLEKHKN